MARRVALVMAGGGGTRLWPASREERPKQLLDPLLAGGSLLARTVQRVAGVVAEQDVWVVVGADQLEGVRAALPGVPAERIIVEPARRNTAPCIALSIAHIRGALGASADDATLLALPADHHVLDQPRLRALLTAACVHAEVSGAIVTLGVEPDHAATGYGYIERQADPLAAIAGDGDTPVFGARRFIEKPDAATAQRFVDARTFLWNSGVFVMPLTRIDAELAHHAAATHAALQPVREALGRGEDPTAATTAAYATIQGAPIDVAVMEKQADLRVVPASVGWTDLGSWQSVYAIGPRDDAGNAIVTTEGANAVVLDGRDNLLWSEDATIGVLGVSGLAVVASGGRVLVCPVARSQEVKLLLERLDGA